MSQLGPALGTKRGLGAPHERLLSGLLGRQVDHHRQLREKMLRPSGRWDAAGWSGQREEGGKRFSS